MFSVCVPPHSKSRITAGSVPSTTDNLTARDEGYQGYLRSYICFSVWRMIGIFDSKNMKHSAQSNFDRSQRAAAWISLLALLLIYAPVASATLMAVTGACCSGDQCPIHGNHHPTSQNTSQNSSDAPMDCDHQAHSTNKMSSCSMSCCRTVEPAAVHMVLTVVGAWWLPSVPPLARMFLGVGVVIAGIAGDLFESMLKRSAGVKDSSSLIPGHGGILDRIDALLFAAPLYYIVLKYV